MIGHPFRQRVPQGSAQVIDLGQGGARRHVQHPDLAPLPVEQGETQGVEADEPTDRLRHSLVDALERQGRGHQGRDLVDHLEAQRPLVEPPDLLHGEPELAGEPRRDAIGAEPARSAPPQQEELPERRRVLPEGGPEQDRRPTPPSRW